MDIKHITMTTSPCYSLSPAFFDMIIFQVDEIVCTCLLPVICFTTWVGETLRNSLEMPNADSVRLPDANLVRIFVAKSTPWMKSGLTWWAYIKGVTFHFCNKHFTEHLSRHGRSPQPSESPGVAIGVARATCHGACLQISAASGQVGGDPSKPRDGQRLIDLEVVGSLIITDSNPYCTIAGLLSSPIWSRFIALPKELSNFLNIMLVDRGILPKKGTFFLFFHLCYCSSVCIGKLGMPPGAGIDFTHG